MISHFVFDNLLNLIINKCCYSIILLCQFNLDQIEMIDKIEHMPSRWRMVDPAYCRGTHVPMKFQIMRQKPSIFIE